MSRGQTGQKFLNHLRSTATSASLLIQLSGRKKSIVCGGSKSSSLMAGRGFPGGNGRRGLHGNPIRNTGVSGFGRIGHELATQAHQFAVLRNVSVQDRLEYRDAVKLLFRNDRSHPTVLSHEFLADAGRVQNRRAV